MLLKHNDEALPGTSPNSKDSKAWCGEKAATIVDGNTIEEHLDSAGNQKSEEFHHRQDLPSEVDNPNHVGRKRHAKEQAVRAISGVPPSKSSNSMDTFLIIQPDKQATFDPASSEFKDQEATPFEFSPNEASDLEDTDVDPRLILEMKTRESSEAIHLMGDMHSPSKDPNAVVVKKNRPGAPRLETINELRALGDKFSAEVEEICNRDHLAKNTAMMHTGVVTKEVRSKTGYNMFLSSEAAARRATNGGKSVGW